MIYALILSLWNEQAQRLDAVVLDYGLKGSECIAALEDNAHLTVHGILSCEIDEYRPHDF
jgi:hypothetical protein